MHLSVQLFHCTFTVPCTVQIYISEIVFWVSRHIDIGLSPLLLLELVFFFFFNYINQKCCTVIRIHTFWYRISLSFHTNYMQSWQNYRAYNDSTSIKCNDMTQNTQNPKIRIFENDKAEKETELSLYAEGSLHCNVLLKRRRRKKNSHSR